MWNSLYTGCFSRSKFEVNHVSSGGISRDVDERKSLISCINWTREEAQIVVELELAGLITINWLQGGREHDVYAKV